MLPLRLRVVPSSSARAGQDCKGARIQNHARAGSRYDRSILGRLHGFPVAAAVHGVRHPPVDVPALFSRGRRCAPRAIAARRPPLRRQSLAIVGHHSLAVRLEPMNAGVTGNRTRPRAIRHGHAVAAAVGGPHLRPVDQLELLLTRRGRVSPAEATRRRVGRVEHAPGAARRRRRTLHSVARDARGASCCRRDAS